MLNRIMSYLEQRLAYDREFLALRKQETAINEEYTRLCIDDLRSKRDQAEVRAAIRALQSEVNYLTTLADVTRRATESESEGKDG